MQLVKVYDTDTPEQIAKKIFNNFEVMQSCTITGYVISGGESFIKGELVINELYSLDKLHNLRQQGNKMARKRKRLKDSIGGYVADKIFRYKKTIDGSNVRYNIWRYQ